ncbi:putative phage abortive infection protein [Pseudomonas sp. SDO55104_S430]
MKNKIGLGWLIAIVVMIVLAVYAGYYYFLYSGFSSPEDLAELKGVRGGTFGDAFGTLNALFSGLAFSGVLITLLIQRKDLMGSQEQNSRQQIESQFYNMLSLQQGVVQSFDIKKNGVVKMVGRDCFKTWVWHLRNEYGTAKGTHEERMGLAYREVMRRFHGDLGLYFRSLYSVFRFVSECQHPDKRKFGNVVRSLLSDFELVILFYNSLGDKGRNFQSYITEFSIFDNLEPAMLLDMMDVLFLAPESYGANAEILDTFSRNRCGVCSAASSKRASDITY